MENYSEMLINVIWGGDEKATKQTNDLFSIIIILPRDFFAPDSGSKEVTAGKTMKFCRLFLWKPNVNNGR